MASSQDMDTNCVDQSHGASPVNIFDKLDDITPSVTNQLQAFCSLAVHQMKQYPAMMQSLQSNINALSQSVHRIHSRIDEIQIKEKSEFEAVHNATDDAQRRLQRIETELNNVAEWRIQHQTLIEQQAQTTTQISEQMNQKIADLNSTVLKTQSECGKRMDAIEDAACTNAHIRDKINNNLDAFRMEFEAFVENETRKRHSLQSFLEENEAKRVLNEEKSAKHDRDFERIEQELDRIEIRYEPLENSTNLLRTDVKALEKAMTEAEDCIHELERFKECAEVEKEMTDRRLIDLETDGRIDKLEALAPSLEHLTQAFYEHNRQQKDQNISLDNRIKEMAQQVAVMYPKVWKLVEEVAAMTTDVQSLNMTSTEASRSIIEAQQALKSHTQEIDRMDHSRVQIRNQLQSLEEDKSQELKEVWKFVEEALQEIPKKYEIADVQKRVDVLRMELLTEIEESQNTVKFDLLHDPSPQVDQLRAYIKQQEDGQSTLTKRIRVLEESVRAQMMVLERTESQLSEALEKLPTMEAAKDEIDDIPKMKQRIQQLGQSTQGLQEQFTQLNQLICDGSDRQSSNLTSSVALNPAALSLLNEKGDKDLTASLVDHPNHQQQHGTAHSIPSPTQELSHHAADDAQMTTLPATPTHKNHDQIDISSASIKQRIDAILAKVLHVLRVEKLSRGNLLAADDVQSLEERGETSDLSQIVLSLVYLTSWMMIKETGMKGKCHSTMANSCSVCFNGPVTAGRQIDQQTELRSGKNTSQTDWHSTLSHKREDSHTAAQTKQPPLSVTNTAQTSLKDNNKHQSDPMVPLILMPPANFYTRRRDIAEEQKKILASMQSNEAA